MRFLCIPLRDVIGSRCALVAHCKVGITEDQSACHLAAPRLDATLQGSKLTVREPSGMLGLEAEKQILGGPLWFLLEPRANRRPDYVEGILASAPMAARERLLTMCRTNLAILPSRRQAAEEPIELGVPVLH